MLLLTAASVDPANAADINELVAFLERIACEILLAARDLPSGVPGWFGGVSCTIGHAPILSTVDTGLLPIWDFVPGPNLLPNRRHSPNGMMPLAAVYASILPRLAILTKHQHYARATPGLQITITASASRG